MINELVKSISDYEIWMITINTFKITGIATMLALVFGLPCSLFLANKDFPFKRLIVSLLNTSMGLPPVIVGLVVSLFFWRSGIFGYLNLLYTPTAMIIAEFIISFPIVTALLFAAFQSIKPQLKEQFIMLGANKFQQAKSIIIESRISALAAIIAGFGAIISEIGAALMVGGNIKGETRVLTTAIVLETRKGNFNKALALGVILLLITVVISYYLTYIQQKEEAWKKT